jgi:TolB-like protein/DNA-binding winged helix-turn-helix (wHTH) protein/Tfp pilus assembly protein PilF
MASEPIRAQEPIGFGEDFQLDIGARRLRRGTHVLKLERIPLEILVLLIEHPGEIVTRDEIVVKVWGKGVFLDTDNSIRGAIRKIRMVLRDDSEQPRFIQTITGQGYRFIAPVIGHEHDHLAGAHEVQSPAGSQSAPTFISELDGWLQTRRLRLETVATGNRRAKISRARSWLAVGGAALLVALLAFNYVFFQDRPATPTENRIRSLAVLPLANLSGDPEQDYVADGMTEALITDLAKIGALRVISRTSVMQYKTGKKPLPQIGRELNVDAVLEGSVQRSGNHVRVTAQLIQVSPERHLWAESYDSDLRDILTLQGELAQTITGEIRVTMTPQEQARLTHAHPIDPAAYEAYLKGLYYFNDGREHIGTKDGDKSFQKSLRYLQQAIQIDPNYATAYAQLARTYHWLATPTLRRDLAAKSKIMASKALELDPTLADAHAALAFVMYAFEWNWSEAGQQFRRAIELNPNYGDAHHGYALFLETMGRRDEAIAEIDKALQLDPLTLPQKINAAGIYVCAGEYDRAIEQLRTVLVLNPKFAEAHFELGRIYVRRGMFEQGIEEIREGAKLTGGDVYSQRQLALAYAASGRQAEARALLHHLPEKATAPAEIAAIYASLGEQSSAVAWLSKVAQQDPVDFAAIRCDESFNSLRADPRVQAMFSRLGLVQQLPRVAPSDVANP